MSKYTAFDLHEEEALGRWLSLEQAFAMACKRAGFAVEFFTEGAATTLTFRDTTAMDRDQPAMTVAHDVPARARRELMLEAGHRGVWGIFVETDLYWENQVEKMRLQEARAWNEVPMSDGAQLRMMKRATITEDGKVVLIDGNQREAS